MSNHKPVQWWYPHYLPRAARGVVLWLCVSWFVNPGLNMKYICVRSPGERERLAFRIRWFLRLALALTP